VRRFEALFVTGLRPCSARAARDNVGIAAVPPVTSHLPGAAGAEPASHFRAHGRRLVRLNVTLRAERAVTPQPIGSPQPPGDWERSGTIVDLTLAGAGVETDEPLVLGERVSVAFATPTLWDPLILTAVVAWANPARHIQGVDMLGRPRSSARAGLAFDYPTPDATLAMFEMLVAIGFE
jgi:hypothetical protein